MVTVFLPCRAGSQRVPKKNTRDFAGIKGGLLVVKLNTLLKVNSISKIVVSTNDDEVIEIANSFGDSRIIVDVRPDYLASSEASTDDVINYVPTIIEDDHIFWTHVTSPFITVQTIEEGINLYFQNNEFDSLMTVNKIQTFLWNKEGAINYDREVEKWPRTQTLPSLYEINSGFFISSRRNYVELKDRIGKKPYLFVTKGYESVDIDWPDDFVLAEMIYTYQKLK